MSLTKPECLHVPVLYEDGQAELIWKPVSGATDGYELYAAWDSDSFSAGSSLKWNEIESTNKTWDETDESDFTWSMIENTPTGLIFKGPGVEVPAPDLGLTWGELDAKNLTWAQIESEIPSWQALEEMYTPGLKWDSLDAQWLTWAECEVQNLTWADIEQMTPDIDPHLSHTIYVPLNSKTVMFRVRACDGNGYSPYIVTSVITIEQLLNRRDSILLSVKTGETFEMQIQAEQVVSGWDEFVTTLGYDPAKVEYIDFERCGRWGETKDPDGISAAETVIVQKSSGKVQFACKKPVSLAKEWRGLVGRVRMKGKVNGTTAITLS